MKKIKLKKWKSNLDGKDIDEDLLTVLNVLLGNKKAEDIPRGIDKMRLFGRIRRAFEKADETNELILEEAEYEFLKKTIENEIPSLWGMNKNISEAVEEFLNLPSDENI